MAQTASELGTPVGNPSPDHILVVDDEPMIRDGLSEYLNSEGFVCETATTGHEALERLSSQPFALVVTDLQMPEMNGVQLIESLSKKHPDVASIMITGVGDLDTAVQTMKHGASDYITKPFDLRQVVGSVKRALELRHTHLQIKKTSEDLQAVVHKKSAEFNAALQDLCDHREMTLDILMRALDARGHETQTHSQRVQAYTVRLAQQFGLNGDRMLNLARGALLHDIGKIGVSDSILLKPGKLTPKEWEQMKKHPTIGYQILKGVKFLEQSACMVLCHHERIDGRGYPQGLRGTEIPLEARIFSVLDAYDAMTVDRPYRKALSAEEACSRIMADADTQFDPKVVEEFLKVPQPHWNQIKLRFND